MNESFPSRYRRQETLPGIGDAGQARLAAARVAVLGCGALGSASAELLVRAGVGQAAVDGYVKLVDRDVVEWTNLQRQSLYSEDDARQARPKAEAARARLQAVNGDVELWPHVTDINAQTIEPLCVVDADAPASLDLIVDGLDNFETRYLANAVAVKHGIPYVYAGAVGTAGMLYPVLPPTPACDSPWEQAGVVGADLVGLFGDAPAAGSSETCATAGVLGPLIQVIGGLAAAEAMKILVGDWSAVSRTLTTVELWQAGGPRVRQLNVKADGFDRAASLAYLDTGDAQPVVLCGREAVQLPAMRGGLSLEGVAERFERDADVSELQASRFMLRASVRHGDATLALSLFPDGRAIVDGTSDPLVARAVVAGHVGG